MTSNDVKTNSYDKIKKTKTKNNLKGGSVQDNIEKNENYLDTILKNNSS